MPQLLSFNQTTTMAMVGNPKGHCFGMCASIGNHLTEAWVNPNAGGDIAAEISKYMKVNSGIFMWANICETVQNEMNWRIDRATAAQAALNRVFNTQQVSSTILNQHIAFSFPDLLNTMVNAGCFPINAAHPNTLAFVLCHRLPHVAEGIMTENAHAMLIVMDYLPGVRPWNRVLTFDPNQGLFEFSSGQKAQLEGWWQEYGRRYRGIGEIDVINLFNMNAIATPFIP